MIFKLENPRQGMKKGIVEMADLVLVNKADGELKSIANHAKVEYMHALQLLRHRSPTWTPMVYGQLLF